MKKIIVLCTLSMLAVTLLVWRAVAKPSTVKYLDARMALPPGGEVTLGSISQE